MRRIFKYPIPVRDEIEVMMPEECLVISCQAQHGKPYIWAVIDDDTPLIPHHFNIVGTGQPADHLDGAFIDTFQLEGGNLVFHLFHCHDDS